MMRTRRAVITLISIGMACMLPACTPVASMAANAVLTATHAPFTASPVATALPPASEAIPPMPSPSATRKPTSVTLPTSPPAAPQLCSPLQGITLEELQQPELLKNAFDPPRPGMDGGHQGVDFAYWSRAEHKTMQGHPVQAVLAGQVAAVLPLRQPYGYALIIESPLNNLPDDWITRAPIPTPAPTVPPDSSLYCPVGAETEGLPIGQFPDDYSLYLLYAHLDQPPDLQTGQNVDCGQIIAAAGTTGNSVNVHLHLETRLGPSGAVFSSMDHYDNAATDLEMSNYCAWRVSGLFQLIDPLQVLSLQP